MKRYDKYDGFETLSDIEELLLYLAFYGRHTDRKLMAKYFENISMIIELEGSEEAEFLENPRDIIKTLYKSFKLNNELLHLEYKKMQDALKKRKIKFISVLDDSYPKLLRKISGYPLGLFYRGDISLLSRPCVSVVGSRKSTYDGAKMCDMLAKHLKGSGVVVLSGLAFGIDSLIHNACLKYGVKTVSVLPSCVDNPVPRNNLKIANNILKFGGLLISENPPNFNVRPESYVERNRIISGISDRTLVVEGAIRSGSMVTAKFAIEQNRDLYAMVGSISNPVAEGTNYLISQGAKPLVYAKDFYEIDKKASKEEKKKTYPESDILDYIKDKGRAEVDEIIVQSGLDEVDVIAKLTEFEIFGYLRRQGNYVELA